MNKSIKSIFFSAGVLFFLSYPGLIHAQEYSQKLDCFSIIAGKDATQDGSVIIAHNEDTGGDRIINYFKVPRTNYNSGDEITFINGGKLEQVAQTNAFLWINIPNATVCDSYINEYGVVVLSDGCPSREKNPDLTDGGILYMLRRIMADRAKSSREAVQIAGKLIDRFGYADSGRSYMIADSNEGWVLAAVYGKHWVAARIPDNEIAIIPNYYTIGEIDLSDTINFMGSPDIISYAIKQGWYNPEKDGKFNFSKAYAKPESRQHPGNVHRIWRGVNLASGKQYSIENDFPFSFKRQDKISYHQIMNILRDHYEGTKLDHSKNYSLGSPYVLNKATICSKATQYSIVAQLRNWMPVEIRARIWISILRPDVQVYVPWYVNIEKTPNIYRSYPSDSAIIYQFNPPKRIYDPSSEHAYWVCQQLADNVERNYKELMPKVRKTWDAVEAKEAAKINRLERKATRHGNPHPEKTYKKLATYSVSMANKTYKKTKKMVKKTEQAQN